MSNTYAADARDAYKDLREDGGPIVFTVQVTAPVPDPTTGTWTPGTTGSLATRAVQLEDNPQELAQLTARGITVSNPVKLMVAALSDTGVRWKPANGMPFVWSGDTCVVKSYEALDPAGDGAIYFTIIAQRGPDE